TQNLYNTVNSYLSGSLKQGYKYKDVSEQLNNVQDIQLQLPRSTLKLTLTDGYQVFDAIEYKPINNLSLLTPVGTKVISLNNIAYIYYQVHLLIFTKKKNFF